MVDENGKVVSSKPLIYGHYDFKEEDGLMSDSEYTIVLSQTKANAGEDAPSSKLPDGCLNYDGEHIGLDAGNDGKRDGKISVSVAKEDIDNINFAITPSVKIGDLVWIEDDNDGDATTGKVKPVANAKVTATCGDDSFSAITDKNGKYHIDVPVNIGKCTLKVEPNTIASPTKGSFDSNVTDSENSKTHNSAGTTVFVSNKDIKSVDFGFIQEICLGDKVWYDNNLNGIQDSDEQGVRDIDVYLYNATGKEIANTKTDKYGHYNFCGLQPSKNYKLKFKLPEGYNITKKDASSDTIDSDANSNAIIDVFNPTKTQNNEYDVGIYCDCDNPANHKVSASALNIFGLLTTILLILVASRRD